MTRSSGILLPVSALPSPCGIGDLGTAAREFIDFLAAAGQRVPGTVNFCFEGIEGESLLLLLDRKGIAASSGSACTSGSLDPSHVLLALGLPHEVAHGSLRLSVGEYNTDEEMAYIVENVRQVVDYLRSISPVWDELETGVRPHQI